MLERIEHALDPEHRVERRQHHRERHKLGQVDQLVGHGLEQRLLRRRRLLGLGALLLNERGTARTHSVVEARLA